MLYANLPKPKPRRYSIPNEIMILGLSAGALAVYNYLLYVEDRKTYQCYPSYKTIGKALKIKSKGTVAKYVRELEDKCLIYTEPTEVILKDGKKRNGNLKYTIRPIQDAIEHYHYEQMKNVNEVAARAKAQKMLDDYNRKHPKATA
ncbi:MAG: helix-turn-helix domain-containing protein [Lachnospiraceae bacterium]|nr:helix-turn-helix domain-containing protein [Lachnospiraceae bacterium]